MPQFLAITVLFGGCIAAVGLGARGVKREMERVQKEAGEAMRDENEDEDEDWENDSDKEPTVPCPYCRRDILEDSPRCPYCERYISEEDHAGSQKPLWVIVTALACLAAALWWMLALPG